MTEIYHPKGSMCFACKDTKKDCTGLDFKGMPFLYRYNHNEDQFNVVKCTNFTRPQDEHYNPGPGYAIIEGKDGYPPQIIERLPFEHEKMIPPDFERKNEHTKRIA